MDWATFYDVAKWILGGITALLSTGGVIKLIEWRSSRPEAQAKAKVQNVTAETTLGEGWRAYAEQVEKRFEKYEEGYQATIKGLEDKITGLEEKLTQERERHDIIVRKKDDEISHLKSANVKLTETVETLRDQNHILRNQLAAISPRTSEKVEEVKQSLHAHVEESLEELKPHDEGGPAKVL